MDIDLSPNRHARRRAGANAHATIALAAGDRFVREPECREITGLSRSTRWRQERAGKFPRRRKISDGATGWLMSEIATWFATRAG
jgi:prophage regulatory protein